MCALSEGKWNVQEERDREQAMCITTAIVTMKATNSERYETTEHKPMQVSIWVRENERDRDKETTRRTQQDQCSE